MNQRLVDAIDLLKMLEVVFEQRQAFEQVNGEGAPKRSSENNFPWAGVRLTLKQSRELLLELASRETVEQRVPDQTFRAPTQETRKNYQAQTARRVGQEQVEQNTPNFVGNTRERSPGSAIQAQRADFPRPEPMIKREDPKPEAREEHTKSEQNKAELTERSYRGTFNRIQLTQEPITTSEEQLPTS